MRKTRIGAYACALLMLAGCVGLPRHVIKYRSEALREPQETTLGGIVAASEPEGGGQYVRRPLAGLGR